MAERRSALTHLPAAATGVRIALSEFRPGTILQLHAWPQTLGTMRRIIAELLMLNAPAIGQAESAAGVTIAAIAPGRFLIAANAGDLLQRFQAALTPEDGTVSDVSHGRVILKLEGAAAQNLLQACVMIDLDPAAFPPGRMAQTMIHHIDVAIHRRAETHFEIWVLRSFAEALAEWLLDASGGLASQ
jgi:heterotetrameric sarcosine oxidase gamma subunit